MEYYTNWRNIGGWANLRVYPNAGLMTPWGNMIVKRWKDRLFSERYGYRKALRIGPLCISFVRLRRFI